MEKLAIFVVLLWAIGSGGPSAAAVVTKTPCDDSFTGTIRAVIQSGTSAWEYELTNRGLQLVKRGPASVHYKAEMVPGSWYGAGFVPEEIKAMSGQLLSVSERFDSPFSASPNGLFAAVVIYPLYGRRSQSPSDRMALLRIRDNTRSTPIINSMGGIESVSWAPDSAQVAIIESIDATKVRSLSDIAAKAIGHQIPYRTIQMAIYSASGDRQCAVTLSKSVPYGEGYLRWN
jgi:hypothetical protein